MIKRTETIAESFVYNFKWLLSVSVTVYILLILGVLPFYFEDGYTHIGTDKSMFFKTCTVFMSKFIGLLFVLYLLFLVIAAVSYRRQKKLWKPQFRLSAADCFAALYAGSVMLSFLYSDYRETALWGTKGWFMGMIPHLTLVSIYYLVSRFQIAAKWILHLCLPVSAVIFVLGCLNRFDVWPLPMENSGLPSYISTIGNINWYCGYIVTVLFIGVGLLWLCKGAKRWYTVLLSAYCCLGFATLITQGSDSGLFALAVVLFVMFFLSAKSKDTYKMRQFWWIVWLFSFACLMIGCVRLLFPEQINKTSPLMNVLTDSVLPVFMVVTATVCRRYTGHKAVNKVWRMAVRGLCVVLPVALCIFVVMIAVNTVNPGSLGILSEKKIFTFDNNWGSSRGATWKFGLAIFKEQDMLHKLVGVGPDCMADYLYKDSSGELQAEVKNFFKNQRLTNAHNEILTLLVNEGICGSVTFLGMIVCLLKKLLQAFEKNSFAGACGLCLLAYSANNIWSFQQILSVSTIFVIMGLGAHFLRVEEDAGNEIKKEAGQ